MPSHPTEPVAGNLKKLFADAVQALEAEVADPRERGMAFFLFILGVIEKPSFDVLTSLRGTIQIRL